MHAVGHAYGCTVMLGDVQTMRLKSQTVIERVCAGLTDQCVKLHLSRRQLFHSSFVRRYLQKAANSRKTMCSCRNRACVLFLALYLQKVIILPRLAAT